MKQFIKNLLGPQNTLKISKFRKGVRISTNRFIRMVQDREKISSTLQPRCFDLQDAHVFFGYYDVPQFSEDENFLLAMVAPLMHTTPRLGDKLRIGFFDLREKSPLFKEIGSTETWCWQQGCRLQWYSNSDRELAIYNCLVEERYGCVIQNVFSGKIVKKHNRPIYAVSRDGKWGLFLDFSRLQRLRPGYGYSNMSDISKDKNAPSTNGLWRINMKTGEEKLLFSLNAIAKFRQNSPGTDAQHYFNHLLFNPEGNRFMFFHIMQKLDGKRKIRMLTSDIDGENIRLLNNSGHASHYCWKGNDHILCYSTLNGQGEGYYLYDDRSGAAQVVGAHVLTEDGHPSYLPGRQFIITDNYPDKYGEQSLLLYDCATGRSSILSKEFSPVQFHDEMRCDLHPRVSPSGRYVCIDCIINGRRAMKVFDMSSFLN